MTTETYRRQNKEEIKSLEELWGCPVDIGHIVAKANGGANDSRNYVPIPRHFNRSIGRRRDDLMFAYVGPNRTAEAVTVSQQHGDCALTVREAQSRGRRARQELAEYWETDAPDSGYATDNPEDEVAKALEKASHDLQTFKKIVEIWNKLNSV